MGEPFGLLGILRGWEGTQGGTCAASTCTYIISVYIGLCIVLIPFCTPSLVGRAGTDDFGGPDV